jgi:hypothetical protein
MLAIAGVCPAYQFGIAAGEKSGFLTPLQAIPHKVLFFIFYKS